MDAFSVEPYWSSDGSALWRHGLRPSLHPPTFLLSLTYYPLIAPNYHVTLLPPMVVLEERKILICAVWKSTRLGLDACWPAGNWFPNSVSTWGLFYILFRIRFIVGWRGQDCLRSQAVGGKNGCNARGNFCMYNFVYIFLAIIMKVVFWLEACWMPKKGQQKWCKSVVAVARLGDK
jgi:hypothetical protein